MGLVIASGGGAGFLVVLLIALIVAAIEIASLWIVFTKAGEKGWKAIIPIWSNIVQMRIIGRPVWWVILLFIPFVNFIVLIIVYLDLAKAFGKGVGFGIGLVFLPFIFMPLLAFGDARYTGPVHQL
jgi:hypothetical protein